jgi:hypothetical protein
MYRELYEEVGLQPQHVRVLGRTRDWLRYEVPQHWIKREWRGSFRDRSRRALRELERYLHVKPQTRRERLYGLAHPAMPDLYADPSPTGR